METENHLENLFPWVLLHVFGFNILLRSLYDKQVNTYKKQEDTSKTSGTKLKIALSSKNNTAIQQVLTVQVVKDCLQ